MPSDHCNDPAAAGAPKPLANLRSMKRCILLLLSALLLGASARAEVLPIASFETGTDGFGGALRREATGGKLGEGCGLLTNADQPWVEAAKSLGTLDHDLAELRFWARSASVTTVTMRLVDSAGHNYQQRLPLTADGGWHEFRITRFNQGEAWGGQADGQWVAPAKSLTFVLEAKGSLYLDGIEATLADKPVAAAFAVRAGQLGNVFVAGQPLAIPISTTASRLDYTVTDWFGRRVASGTAPVTDGQARLSPEVKTLGHFTAKVKCIGGPGDEHEVDFAVVEPATVAKDSPFGVMTHFAQGWDPAIIPLITRAGLGRVRDEAYWGSVETERGRYDFGRYDGYLGALRAAGIEPLVPLTFENKLYDGGDTPHSDAGREGYAAYGVAVERHLGAALGALEVWNEYNGSWCKGPAAADRPKSYAAMLHTAYQRIKAANPRATVLGSGVVTIPLPYLEALFRAGALADMDGVVIHPYRGKPEGVEQDIAALRAMMRRYGGEKPIWATEYGYMDKDRHQPTVPKLLVRHSVLMLSQGVHRMYWYLLRDYHDFVGMGLLHDDRDPRGAWSPAPAYGAMAAMVRLLAEARFVAREAEEPYSRTYVMRFDRGGEPLRVCWAQHPSRLRCDGAGQLTRIDLMGNRTPLAAPGGVVELPVDDTPFYLAGPVAKITELPGAERVVADSVADYTTKAQGEAGWHYGWFDEGTGAYRPDAFQPFEAKADQWGEKWAGPMPFLSAGAEGMHPQVRAGKGVWAIRRWVSTVAGQVALRGRFERDRQGDGCTVRVLVDGQPLFDQPIGGPTAPTERPFELTLAAHVGTVVDFVVTPGPAAQLDYDATGFDVQVLLKR